MKSRRKNSIVTMAIPNILEIYGLLSNMCKLAELFDELICFVIMFPKIKKDFINPNPNPAAILDDSSSSVKISLRLQLKLDIEVNDLW